MTNEHYVVVVSRKMWGAVRQAQEVSACKIPKWVSSESRGSILAPHTQWGFMRANKSFPETSAGLKDMSYQGSLGTPNLICRTVRIPYGVKEPLCP